MLNINTFKVGEKVFTTYYGNRSYPKVVKSFEIIEVGKGEERRKIYSLKLLNEKTMKVNEYYCEIDCDEFCDLDFNWVTITHKRIPLKRDKNRNFVLYD